MILYDTILIYLLYYTIIKMGQDIIWLSVIAGILVVLLVAVFLMKRCNTSEYYDIARDAVSKEMFEKLHKDLQQIYPHDISKLDMKGLVSCIPEDSYTENKKHVCICLRNKKGEFYPYSKLLKIGIHELAHVMSKQHDPEHKTEEFHTNHNLLIKKARELKLPYDS
jgi:hypothetical protein